MPGKLEGEILHAADTSQAAVFEADEAAEGKGISASSFFPPDCFQRERQRKVKQDPSRFIHTPTPSEPPTAKAGVGKRDRYCVSNNA